MSLDLFVTNYVTDNGHEIWVDAEGREWVYDPDFLCYVEVLNHVKTKDQRINWSKEGL
jgi:hypothetical protein